MTKTCLKTVTETGSEKMSCGEIFQPVCGFAQFAAADSTHFFTSSSHWLAKIFIPLTVFRRKIKCLGGVGVM